MAIALDSSQVSTTSSQAANTAFTFSYTVISNTNGILIVAISDGDNHGSNHQIPSAVSYAGNALTKVTGASSVFAQFAGSIWYLVAPPTGSNTVSITIPTTGSGAGDSRITAFCGSYTGGSQTAPDSSNTGSAGSGTSFSLSTTTVADNCWTIALFISNQAANPAASTNTTSRQTSNTVGQGNLFGDSNGVIHPAGSFTMTVTGTSGLWGGCIISIAPALPIPFFFPTYPDLQKEKIEIVAL